MRKLPNFERHDLGDEHVFFTGWLPTQLVPDVAQFESMWTMHPVEYHEVKIHGRLVCTPRWQQAFGMDYHYSGGVNRALPLPSILKPLVAWAKDTIDDRLNGVLLNWYEGKLGHYIGRHRDSTVNMVSGAAIVTMSFGEGRIFRLRPWPAARGKERRDFEAGNGTVFVMPFETNLAWTHEVPAARNWTGRRMSVTFRAFKKSPTGTRERRASQ